MIKRLISAVLCFLMLASLAACGSGLGVNTGKDASTRILLEGDSAKVIGGGAAVKGSEIIISAAGSFTVSGKLDNGRIRVDTGDEPGRVSVTLDGADIHCPDGAAIYIEQAKDVTIYLADETRNSVSSGDNDTVSAEMEDSNGAAVFSEDDLCFSGTGSLTVNGLINNGITCKDDLRIESGEIVINAANNGIKGSESVTIDGGVISVISGNDGIKSTSANKEGKGYVAVNAGAVSIDSVGDGISAETELNINGGTLNISTSGSASGESCKALKAKTGLYVSDGVIELNAADHAIHCTAGISINGGVFTVQTSSGKGIAAHDDISISGGSLCINSSSDGIESMGDLLIKGGVLDITSGSEGLRAGESNSNIGDITIEDGDISITASGDAVDAKGSLQVSGGKIFAIGNSKKLKSFDDTSTQPFICVSLSGGTPDTVSVSDSGKELCSISSAYSFNSVLYSSGELKSGCEYAVNSLRSSQTALAD